MTKSAIGLMKREDPDAYWYGYMPAIDVTDEVSAAAMKSLEEGLMRSTLTDLTVSQLFPYLDPVIADVTQATWSLPQLTAIYQSIKPFINPNQKLLTIVPSTVHPVEPVGGLFRVGGEPTTRVLISGFETYPYNHREWASNLLEGIKPKHLFSYRVSRPNVQSYNFQAAHGHLYLLPGAAGSSVRPWYQDLFAARVELTCPSK